MSLKPEHFEFWIRNNYNVLFIGKHGVGKTSLIKQAFEIAGLNWKYYSASTMDPWVDFIGVPKEKTDENGQSYLDLVRPKDLEDDNVEAIFLDEYNRSHKKIRNAVMELIQFKSINGKKLNNLRMIWAAINPDDDADETYDVEKLDPAQADRFQIKVEIPYKPSRAYFINQYGREKAIAACEWWAGLSEKTKNEVSPRRLDYAVDIYTKNGDLSYVLPKESNIGKLIYNMNEGPIKTKLESLCSKSNEAVEFLKVENNYSAAIDLIMSKLKYKKIFMPLLEKEKLATLLPKHWDYMLDEAPGIKVFREVISETITADANKPLIVKIAKGIKKRRLQKWFGPSTSHVGFSYKNTQERRKVFDSVTSMSKNKNLTDQEIQAGLNSIDLVVKRSNLTTIKRWGVKALVAKMLKKLSVMPTEAEIRSNLPNIWSKGVWK